MGEFGFWEKWGLDLSDKQFANAFTALGVLAGSPEDSKGRTAGGTARSGTDMERMQHEIGLRLALGSPLSQSRQSGFQVPWKYPLRGEQVVIADRMLRLKDLDPALLAGSWEAVTASLGDIIPRFRILGHPAGDPVKVWFRLLFEADPEGASAHIDFDAPHASLHLQWPLRIGYLPGNIAEESLRFASTLWPLNQLTHAVRIGRENANSDLLVFNGSTSRLLKSLLDLQVPHKCNLFVLRGHMEDNDDSMQYRLAAIAAKSRASGFIFLSPDISDKVMALALNRCVENLSHNQPFDVAVSEAFAVRYRADPAIYLSEELVTVRIERLMEAMHVRLRRMPAGSRADIRPETLARMNIPAGDLGGDIGDLENLEKTLSGHKRAVRYDAESSGASGLAEINRALDRAEEPKEEVQRRSSRFLQQRTFLRKGGRYKEEKAVLMKGVPVLLRIRIGPPEGVWEGLPTEFPEEELPRDQEAWNLTVVLTEPRHLKEPGRKEMRLPKDGPSTECEFGFVPVEAGYFEGRVSVLHRGRVLQTGVLMARVVGNSDEISGKEKIAFTEMIPVRSHTGDLEGRRQYDVSFVLNHTVDNRPRLTAVSSEHAWIADISGCRQVVEDINTALTGVALAVDEYSGGLGSGENVRMLIRLAQLGRTLFGFIVEDQIRDPANRAEFAEKEYIQIVSTKAEALLPLEFIYDSAFPDDNAGLCSTWSDAIGENDPAERKKKEDRLLSGTCRRTDDGKDCRFRTKEYVCPLGFWSMGKVIERHVYTPSLAQPGKDFFLQSEPTTGREGLRISGTAVAAASAKVTPQMLLPVLNACEESLGAHPQKAEDWDQWVELIRSHTPHLLLALPHTDGDGARATLEIGGKKIMSGQITPAHVQAGEGSPLVALLGCDTAGTALEYGSHVSQFRRGGAAVVISTIAKVFGGHAAAVAQKLVRGLGEEGERQERLGEVIRAIKRRALLDGMLMALCVVAFGDADWKLAGKE